MSVAEILKHPHTGKLHWTTLIFRPWNSWFPGRLFVEMLSSTTLFQYVLHPLQCISMHTVCKVMQRKAA